VRMRIWPIRVRSPFNPVSGNFAFWKKSVPAAILIFPGGVVSISSVNSGRCCATIREVAKMNSTTEKRRIFIGKSSKPDLTFLVDQ